MANQRVAIPIPSEVLEAAQAEADETFFVNLANIQGPGAVMLADAQGLGTITNDDTSVDLAVTKTESVDPVEAGSGPGNLSYLVTVTNDGPSDATGVEITETPRSAPSIRPTPTRATTSPPRRRRSTWRPTCAWPRRPRRSRRTS